MKTPKLPEIQLPFKINYGCGESKLKGFMNIDIEKSVKPDMVLDLRTHPFPFHDETAELIHCIHNLEHIELKHWPQIFYEFHRVLKPGGKLVLAYPEFEKCATNFISNYKGMREFWRWTLYGRQLYPGDFHVVPMDTRDVIDMLSQCGFNQVKSKPEPGMEYNTFLIAIRGTVMMSKGDVLKREIFDTPKVTPIKKGRKIA